ncbi:MAG: ferric reductase-like transmembrane domain-containing protein, partial [Syntrophales bacterium]|nr:ferric reductase-like transmembrane domain-containing protein [Syntrophales bacterium]
MWSVSLRLFIYVGIILGIVAAASLRGVSSGNIIYEIGMNFALAGFAILILQVILAARFKWIERPVGFDILIRYHKYMALFAALLIIMHPLLLAAGGAGWRIIYALDVPWYIWFGRIAFIIAIVNVLLSVYQGRIKLKFEKWRFTHDILGPSIIGLAFIHSLIVGDDLELRFMKIIWIAALALAVIIFSYHRIARPLILKNRPYRVIDVHPEAENVWTIKLAPPEGRTVNPYLPGQFHFITFYRGRNLPVEEHHWTISSSPAKKGYVTSTIKALGDFTATMGETRKGDKAAVHGAFGRFSYALHPEERDLVFIAGGIGITPLMSMLRHMRDTRDTRSVLLLYANSDRDHIVFMQELDQIEKNGRPSLKIVHVL